MPSEFEQRLLPELRRIVPDLVPEKPLEGFGKKWLVNLYSAKENIVIEACSRNVVRTGRTRSSIQHNDKFYSMLLKLVDIKKSDPSVKPVMIWKDLVPAHSPDIGLCNAWGIYLQSSSELHLKEIVDGASPTHLNRSVLKFLIRRSDKSKPRWRWLVSERRRTIAELLSQQAMGIREICEAVGIEYGRRSEVSRMLRELGKTGQIRKLMPGYVRGHGAIYGTRTEQLDPLEGQMFSGYRQHKRSQRVATRILELLKKEGPADYKRIQRRLEENWKLSVDRNVLIGILSKNLAKRGLVKVEGPPKKKVYSV